MISILFLVFSLFVSHGLADYEQLNKQIYCTPSTDRNQYSVGLAFSAPYKGTYDQLPTADGTTFVATHVEIYDHTCNSPLYTNEVAWSDVNSTVYAIDEETHIYVRFSVYPNWRRYGKQCYQYGNVAIPGTEGGPGTVTQGGISFGLPPVLEQECEDYESLYHCDASSLQDSSFCSVKLGNLTIETEIGGMVLRKQYSRLFKYARTDVGDACNCWQEMDGFNYVFACGCAVSTNLDAQKLPGLSPPGQSFFENYNQVQGRQKVDPASTITVSHRTGAPDSTAITYSSSSKSSKHSTHSRSHKTTSKSVSSTKSHSSHSQATAGSSTHKKTSQTTLKTTSRSSKRPSTVASSTHGKTSQTTLKPTLHSSKHSSTTVSSIHKKTTQTTSKTTSLSSKHSPAPASSMSSTASDCSLMPVSGVVVEVCTKATAPSTSVAVSLCTLSIVSGTVVEHCAKETTSRARPHIQ